MIPISYLSTIPILIISEAKVFNPNNTKYTGFLPNTAVRLSVVAPACSVYEFAYEYINAVKESITGITRVNAFFFFFRIAYKT